MKLIEEDLCSEIIGGAIEVHRALGPGLLESAYERCLAHELTTRGLSVARQKQVHLHYKGLTLPDVYRVDLIISGRVLVEVKAIDESTLLHEAQLLTYLKLTGVRVGLLLNFNVLAIRPTTTETSADYPPCPSASRCLRGPQTRGPRYPYKKPPVLGGGREAELEARDRPREGRGDRPVGGKGGSELRPTPSRGPARRLLGVACSREVNVAAAMPFP